MIDNALDEIGCCLVECLDMQQAPSVQPGRLVEVYVKDNICCQEMGDGWASTMFIKGSHRLGVSQAGKQVGCVENKVTGCLEEGSMAEMSYANRLTKEACSAIDQGFVAIEFHECAVQAQCAQGWLGQDLGFVGIEVYAKRGTKLFEVSDEGWKIIVYQKDIGIIRIRGSCCMGTMTIITHYVLC